MSEHQVKGFVVLWPIPVELEGPAKNMWPEVAMNEWGTVQNSATTLGMPAE